MTDYSKYKKANTATINQKLWGVVYTGETSDILHLGLIGLGDEWTSHNLDSIWSDWDLAVGRLKFLEAEGISGNTYIDDICVIDLSGLMTSKSRYVVEKEVDFLKAANGEV